MRAGMTLVELMVAMTLLGLLSVAMFGGLGFGARSWDTLDRSAAVREGVARAQGFLADRLAAVSIPRDARGRSRVPALAGGPERVSFTAPWLSRLALGGLYRFTLWHEPGPAGGGRLMIAWAPMRGDDPTGATDPRLTDRRALIGGVRALRLRYYGAGQEDAAPGWRAAWEAPAPPEMVSVEVELAAGAGSWPPLVVARPGGPGLR